MVQLEKMKREQAKRNILLRFYREVCKVIDVRYVQFFYSMIFSIAVPIQDMSDPEKTMMRLLRLVLDALNVCDVVLFIADYASRDFICCSGSKR